MIFIRIAALLLLLPINVTAALPDPIALTAKRSDGSTISYYIYERSKGHQSQVLLLVLQGSDCNSVVRIKSIFSDYMNVWPEADLLLVEKYGIHQDLSYSPLAERKDCPHAYLEHDNPKQRVNDIDVVLNAIGKDHTYKRVVVLGGSEGAVIANLLAAENGDVDAVISFNGGGRWFFDDVLHSIASEHPGTKASRDSMEGFKGFSQHVLNSEPFEMNVSGHGYGWWHQMLSIDQLSVLGKVKVPLLVVQGGMDKLVSPQKVNDLMTALKAAGKHNIKYLFYKNLDHHFDASDGQSGTGKVISDMNAWLRGVLSHSER